MKKITSFGILISVLGVFTVISVYLFNSIENSIEKKEWEVHSKNVVAQINILLKYNYRHESILRGFIITKDSASYNRFIKNGDDFKKSLDYLDSLVSQDDRQVAIVDSLKSLHLANTALLKEILKSASNPQQNEQTISNIKSGNKINRKITLLADEMIRQENIRLKKRDKAFRENVNQSKSTLIFLFIFFVLFMFMIISFVSDSPTNYQHVN